MLNFCTKVMQYVLKQKSETFSNWIFELILREDLGHIFPMDSQCIESVMFYHEKDHFLLELLSYLLAHRAGVKVEVKTHRHTHRRRVILGLPRASSGRQ